ncbi:MAG: 2-isopropylmalate synthase [Pseudomonadota bacterium]
MTNTDNAARDRVQIFDTTLRDGEQSPGATMTLQEKLSIAQLLDEMGVDIIEAGFPIASDGDFEAVSEIARMADHAVICGLARAAKGDIDRAWAALEHAKKPRIHTFIGTSPLHRQHQLQMDKDQVLRKIEETVGHARSLCENVQWSPMDATRTERDYLIETVRVAVDSGATTINIPDTVGYTAPRESAHIIRDLLDNIPTLHECVIATHCHNDLGMATANSLAAVEAGARQIECTINGLGERAGNTALEEVVMALKVRRDIMPYETGVDTTQIMKASRMVATAAGFPVQFNKAIVGKNAFAHESGIHQDGVLKNAETFEIMRPQDVGLADNALPMGKHSGRAAFRAKLKDLGIEMGDNAFQEAFVRFKALADTKKDVFDEDIIALIDDSRTSAANDSIRLKSLQVACGTEGPQSADMVLTVDDVDHEAKATGDGPVDAVFSCIDQLVQHDAVLKLYQVQAVTDGIDAQATVSVRLEEDGKIVQGQAADTDTIVASARAYIIAINKLMVRRGKTAPNETQAL